MDQISITCNASFFMMLHNYITNKHSKVNKHLKLLCFEGNIQLESSSKAFVEYVGSEVI